VSLIASLTSIDRTGYTPSLENFEKMSQVQIHFARIYHILKQLQIYTRVVLAARVCSPSLGAIADGGQNQFVKTLIAKKVLF
jgi:hypothetical protein